MLEAYFGEPIPANILADAVEALELTGSSFDADGYPSELDAAVAEVLLQSRRDELPQWVLVERSRVIRGRQKITASASPFKPQHLFTINWADSAPGFSWPVAYYATRVSDFGRVIVTASADGVEMYGFTDFAIGHFAASADLLTAARTAVVSHWSLRAQDGQRRWEYLQEPGLVTAELASRWAGDVEWDEDP